MTEFVRAKLSADTFCGNDISSRDVVYISRGSPFNIPFGMNHYKADVLCHSENKSRRLEN
jgi:hypothetical protein